MNDFFQTQELELSSDFYTPSCRRRPRNGQANRLTPEDCPIHDWYRLVLSFPPHLVRGYIGRFGLNPTHTELDPFCGTGTTLVECKKHGIPSVGIEANPIAAFASKVKDEAPPLRSLPSRAAKLLLTDSISPIPLHRTLTLIDRLELHRDERFHQHERLALAKALVTRIGNLEFGPEVGVGPPKADVPVVTVWLSYVRAMADDLRLMRTTGAATARVHHADARRVTDVLQPRSIDAVITSPPYPNEKDYTRTTRLETVLLGFATDMTHLRAQKQQLIRSNTRGVYKADDDKWVASHEGIQRIAEAIEAKRIELG